MVITALTRNEVTMKVVRGFESHLLRHKPRFHHDFWAFLFYFMMYNLIVGKNYLFAEITWLIMKPKYQFRKKEK